MIVYLRGKVLMVVGEQVVLDVGGVGYEVFVPKRVARKLGEGQDLEVHVRTVYREDATTLYGFTDIVDRVMFDILLKVSGVGPRLAYQILSHVDASTLAGYVVAGDTRALRSLPSVGRKLADRLVLELKDRVSHIAGQVPGTPGELAKVLADVRSALLNLGYDHASVEEAMRDLPVKEGADITELLRVAIGRLSRLAHEDG